MAETALIAVDMDITAIHKRLAEIEGATKEEARIIRKELQDAYKANAKAAENAAKLAARAQSRAAREAEREAKRAARAIDQSINEQTSAVRGLATAAFGGMAGDLLDVADATGGVSAGLGAIGVGLGVVAVGVPIVTELAAQMLQLGHAAVEARDAIEAEGIALERVFSPAELQALEDYEQTTEDLSTAVNLATVALATSLLPTLEKLETKLTGLTPHARLLGTALEGSIDVGTTVGFGALQATLEQMVPGMGTLTGAAFDLASGYLDAQGEAEQLAIQTARVESRNSDAEFQLHQLLEAQKRSNKEEATAVGIKKRLAEQAEAAKKALDEQRKAQKELNAAVGEIKFGPAFEVYQDASMVLDGTTESLGFTLESFKAVQDGFTEGFEVLQRPTVAEALEKLAEDLGEAAVAAVAMADAMSPVISNVQTLARMQMEQHADRAQQLRDEARQSRDTYKSALSEYESSREGMTEIEQAAHEDYLRRLDQSEKAKRSQVHAMRREEQSAAMKAFNVTKSLQIAQASIDAARNAVVLTGHLGFLKFAAPFVAGGIAAAQLATSLAIIKNTPPPTFHFGTSAAGASMPGGAGPVGIPGAEVPAVLEQGEGVVSRRGMATPGMAELVAAVNEGRTPTGRSMVTDIEADLLAQRLNRPYAPAIRGRALAGTNTFYRGR